MLLSFGRAGPRLNRRHFLGSLFALGGAAAGAVIANAYYPLAGLSDDLVTRTGERRLLRLPDGSQLLLNARTRVNLSYTHGARTLHLLEGAISLAARPDAARPFVTAAHVSRLLDALADADGAVPALPVPDTLKRGEGMVSATVSRDGLWRAQTPQAFRLGALLDAYRAWPAGEDPTDDAGVMERAGGRVALVAGDPLLMKLTYPEDFAMAERLDLNPRAPDREVRFLSGGNQRKSLLGRAIFADARLFVLEEPTQGVDVESQRQIHDHLRHLADRGASVVFVSTDLEELIALADRIVVLRGGRIDQELAPAGLTPEHLLAAIQTQRTGSPH